MKRCVINLDGETPASAQPAAILLERLIAVEAALARLQNRIPEVPPRPSECFASVADIDYDADFFL